MKLYFLVFICLLGLMGCKKEDPKYYTEIELRFVNADGSPVGQFEMTFILWEEFHNGYLYQNHFVSDQTLKSDRNGAFLYQQELPPNTYLTFKPESSFFLLGYNKLDALPAEFWNQAISCGSKKSLQFVVSK